MGYQLAPPISERDRNTVATLIAAGVTRSYIRTNYRMSEVRVRTIMQDEGWPALLESKREALKALMGGVA